MFPFFIIRCIFDLMEGKPKRMSKTPETIAPLDNRDLVRAVVYFCAKDDVFESSTRLQKLVFLAQKKFPEFDLSKGAKLYADQPFTFAADSYGPFSKELAAVVEGLEANKELEIKRGSRSIKYTLTSKGRLNLSKKAATLKEPIVSQWLNKIVASGELRLDQLLRYVYQDPTFREYLVRSRIRSRYSLVWPTFRSTRLPILLRS